MYNVYKNFKAPLSVSDATTGGFFGSGKGPVLFSNVLCNGTEDSLNSCAVDDTINVDCEDAGVVCNGKYNVYLSIYLSTYLSIYLSTGLTESYSIVLLMPFFGSSNPKKVLYN